MNAIFLLATALSYMAESDAQVAHTNHTHTLMFAPPHGCNVCNTQLKSVMFTYYACTLYILITRVQTVLYTGPGQCSVLEMFQLTKQIKTGLNNNIYKAMSVWRFKQHSCHEACNLLSSSLGDYHWMSPLLGEPGQE